MPSPVKDLIALDTARYKVAVEPVFNVLQSMLLVSMADEVSGLDDWIVQTASQLSAPEHHDLCHWGLQEAGAKLQREFMRTNAVPLLKEGVALAYKTWKHFLAQQNWLVEQVDKVICHQVGSANQKQVLKALDIPAHKEFPTFKTLGNMGTVSLPVTAAIANEQGFLQKGDNVSFLGLGSGLNCMMLGVQW